MTVLRLAAIASAGPVIGGFITYNYGTSTNAEVFPGAIAPFWEGASL